MNHLRFISFIALSAVFLAGCATNGGNGSQQEKAAQQAPTAVPEKPSGTVQIDFTQIAFIGSGAKGNGVLTFQGRQYPFEVTGVGVGGFGAAKVNATGEVYGLNRLADFAGAYAQGRIGLVVGDTGKGGLWLRNEHGVVMRLESRMRGVALTLGADVLRVSMGQ